MSIQLFSKKLYLLSTLLCFTLVGVTQEAVNVFDEKWEKAQELIVEQYELLPGAIAELKALADNKEGTQYGKIAYLSGEYWYAKAHWLKAKTYFDTAILLLEKDTSEQLTLAEAYLVAGFNADELEDNIKTLFYYQKALALKQQILGTDHPRVASIYFNIGEVYQTELKVIESDAAFQKGLKILEAFYTEENVELADYYEELAYNQSLRYDFKEATKYLKKALQLKEKTFGENHESLVFPYKYLGKVYRDGGYFGEAITYYNKALQILTEQDKQYIFQEAMLHFNIGKSYLELKEYDEAFTHFDQAISIDKTNEFILFATHRLKGEVESEKGNIEAANKHFDIALKGFAKIEKNDEDYLIDTYKLVAKHQLKIGQYQSALNNVQLAIAKGTIIYKSLPNSFFDLYVLLGKCYSALEDTNNAKLWISKAKKLNGGSIDWEFANLKQLKNEVTLNLEYINLCFTNQNQVKDLPTLLKADSLLSATIQLVDHITRTYQEKSTKENFIEEYHKVFKKAIDVKYALYDATQKKQYLRIALILSEKSKNLILLETLNNVDALELAAIPDSIIKKEKSLRVDITFLENRRFEENQKATLNEVAISALNGQIFKLKQEYQTLLREIEVTYPDYFQLKFKSTFVSVPDIQNTILAADETIIEYFLGDDWIYVFLIKKGTFKVSRFPKEKDLISKINQFRESIYSYRPANVHKQQVLNEALVATTNQLGFELYSTLIQPFCQELTQKITIVADGALGYLPFDALITKQASDRKQLNLFNYLMNQHIINHAHSINWLSGLLKKKPIKFTQNFIGVAPEFQATKGGQAIADFRLGLGPLQHNQTEVELIQTNIGGKVITGIAATRQSFLAYIKQGQVLHLATHGKSNDQQGDYSYLAFAKPTDTTDHQFLYVKDLFNLNIPAELVVLSACETGLGEIKRGEGIVGIGKGFSYAGAKSMVTTLWRVSDNSTANFMPLFYKNLKSGQAKDEALWNAKKEFIKTYRTAGHPFFWSGYVAYGNMQPIEFQHINWSISAIIGLLLFGLLVLFLLRYFSEQFIGEGI